MAAKPDTARVLDFSPLVCSQFPPYYYTGGKSESCPEQQGRGRGCAYSLPLAPHAVNSLWLRPINTEPLGFWM